MMSWILLLLHMIKNWNAFQLGYAMGSANPTILQDYGPLVENNTLKQNNSVTFYDTVHGTQFSDSVN